MEERYYVSRYFRIGLKHSEMPELVFATEQEAMAAGKEAGKHFSGVSVCAVSGSLETVLNVSGLARYGDVPEICF